jgi:hypothetical protein
VPAAPAAAPAPAWEGYDSGWEGYRTGVPPQGA